MDKPAWVEVTVTFLAGVGVVVTLAGVGAGVVVTLAGGVVVVALAGVGVGVVVTLAGVGVSAPTMLHFAGRQVSNSSNTLRQACYARYLYVLSSVE